MKAIPSSRFCQVSNKR